MSPVQRHTYWGDFATASQLPNVAAAPTQSALLTVGSLAHVSAAPADLWSCVNATLGAAEWVRAGRGSARIQNLAPYNLNAVGPVLFASWDPTPPLAPVEQSTSPWQTTAVGIVAPTSGRVFASLLTRASSTGARTNYGVNLTVNGVQPASPSVQGAFSYIRAASGHNEASNATSGLLDVAPGDVLSFEHVRLSNNGTAVTAQIGDIKLDVFYLSTG